MICKIIIIVTVSVGLELLPFCNMFNEYQIVITPQCESIM
jgi:hypothetical protein